MMHFLTVSVAALLGWLIQTPLPPPFPLGQVVIGGIVPLYDAPERGAQDVGQAYPGEILLVYGRYESGWGGVWAHSERGWLRLEGMSITPALVNYGVTLETPVSLMPFSSQESPSTLMPGETAGVAAFFEGQALLYTESVLGWADVNQITLTPPSPELTALVERQAFVRVEAAPIYAAPDDASLYLTAQPLGREVTILHRRGVWVFVRANEALGWTHVRYLDVLPDGLARGVVTVDRLNLRLQPVDGMVIAGLTYQTEVDIIGRRGEWLYVQIADGRRGWVFAEFVSFEVALDALPEVAE